MKLTEKSTNVLNALKAHDGRCEINALAEELGVTARSAGANVTDLKKKGLAIREKAAGEGEDAKDITYVVLTDEGMAFDPTADAE